MPYRFRRVCPICHRQELLYLADHLRQVHNLYSEERQPLLKSAIFSHQVTPSLSLNLVSTDVPQGLNTQQGMPSQPLSIHAQPRQLPRPAMKV